MKSHTLCALIVFALSLHCAHARDLRDVFGIAHVDGKYFLTKNDFLNEGADQVLASG